MLLKDAGNMIKCLTHPAQAYFARPNHDDSLVVVAFSVTMTSLPLAWQVLQMNWMLPN